MRKRRVPAVLIPAISRAIVMQRMNITPEQLAQAIREEELMERRQRQIRFATAHPRPKKS